MYFCAVCFRKLQYAVGFDVMKRYEALIEVCEKFSGLFLQKDLPFFQARHRDLADTFKKYSTPSII